MDLVGNIDPAEVLLHLNQLGYRNITPVQLKEFIRDLKKLIVYDHLSSSSGSLTSLSTSVTTDSEYCSASETSSELSVGHSRQNVKQKCTSTQKAMHIKEKIVSKGAYQSSTKTFSISDGCTFKRNSTSSSALSEKVAQKENLPLTKGKAKSMSEEEFQEAVKPKTSFIRPWQLQGMQSGSGRSGRSDPVALYHYYQNLWAQRKCPGEDSHADLRWVIREKMLGQDPHLYSHNILNPRKKTCKLRI